MFFFLSCVCYAFVSVSVYVPCGHLLGKALLTKVLGSYCVLYNSILLLKPKHFIVVWPMLFSLIFADV